MESLLFFLLGLIPIVLYLLVFAWINSRERSVLVNGTWDFVGVLFAASGFLILVGPNILAGIFDRYQLALARGGTRPHESTSYFLWIALMLLYFTVVVVGTYIIILRRSKITTGYNVDPDSFTREFTFILDKQGLNWVRSENTFFVKNTPNRKEHANGMTADVGSHVYSATHPTGQELSSEQSESRPSSAGPRQNLTPAKSSPNPFMEALTSDSSEIDLETSNALRNVTLTWRPARTILRQEIETELAKLCSRFVPRHNPAGFWLLCAASFLILTMFSGGAVILISSLPR
jgi:hypothetical protein